MCCGKVKEKFVCCSGCLDSSAEATTAKARSDRGAQYALSNPSSLRLP